MSKVIAVFADGTGNSSGKLFRTNVWRLYQALDTSDSATADDMRQIAYYHDGVGTSSFKPLAFIGGAFGWGLKRNIIDLYKFICRNYELGDRIYLFGFSRGAFTVRVLGGFIIEEGLVTDTSDEELDAYSHDAYRSYRRCFKHTGQLVEKLRDARDFVIARRRKVNGLMSYKQRQTTAEKNRKIQEDNKDEVAIEFIGAWDTVAAYGTPVEELTRGIDKWIWPLSMPGYHLSPCVKSARHALALDDERDTFHPLLWDERSETKPNRMRQVWFSGMHSDVGGGYPDDALAYVPLEWMLDEAKAAGLRFVPAAESEIRRMANVNGPMHDSRRGIGGYYRYQPRKISAHVDPPDQTTLLMQDPNPQFTALLTSVKIHASVFQRIVRGNDRYAPIVLPGAYTVVPRPETKAGSVEANSAARAAAQERVWDLVWHRRVTYFASVGVSLYLAAMPVSHWWNPPPACTGVQCLITPVIATIGEFLPGFAHPWIAAYAVSPGRFAVAVLILALLLLRSSSLESKIRTDMRNLWEDSLGLPRMTTPPQPARAWVRRLRTSPHYQHEWQDLKWKVAPNLFGWILILLIAVGAVYSLSVPMLRFAAWVGEFRNQMCEQPESNQTEYVTKIACWNLHRTVTDEKGDNRWRVTIAIKKAWSDDTISTGPEGFGPTRMSFWGNLTAPLRRSPDARWFQPLIKIVPREGLFRVHQIEPLEPHLTDPAKGIYEAEFTATTSGDAYFFVNDVLLPTWVSRSLGYPNAFYFNNHGSADVHIEPVRPER